MILTLVLGLSLLGIAKMIPNRPLPPKPPAGPFLATTLRPRR